MDYYDYYWKTFALAIDHGDFSVVYGEVQPPSDPLKYGIRSVPYLSSLKANEKQGLPEGIKKGVRVKRGQHIAYVGQLYIDSGSVKFGNTMVHFELYTNDDKGNFTDRKNLENYLNVDKNISAPFFRRSDLDNPTDFLDNCD